MTFFETGLIISGRNSLIIRRTVMYKSAPIPIPTECKKLIRSKAHNGETYVYFTTSVTYDPKKKINVPTRKAIGKVVPGNVNLMYPNDNYYTFFPDDTKSKEIEGGRSRCINVGSFLVFQSLIGESGFDTLMSNVFKNQAGFALDIALYYIIKKSNVMQFYPNYAKTHPVFTEKQKMYSDATVSDFFYGLGENNVDVFFQDEWTKTKAKDNRIYISYDSTNKGCDSGNITITEYSGHAKKGEGAGKIVNISIGYDHTAKEPVFYELYSGSIVDVSELKYAIQKANSRGFTNVGFILDRGYFSRANIQYMDKHNIPYIIMVKGLQSWIKDIILANVGTFEHDGKHLIEEKGINGITLHTQISHVTDSERYCHLFYSPEHDAADCRKISADLKAYEMELAAAKEQGEFKGDEKKYSKYFNLEIIKNSEGKSVLMKYSRKDDVIDEMYRLAGYFAIVTSDEMSAKEALLTYKNRDEVEKLFREDKAFAPSERVASDESLRGKVMTEFIALILYSKFISKLEDANNESIKHPNYLTSTAAIEELEKIKMIAGPDNVYRLDTALTKNQKEVLKVFGIDASSVYKYVTEYSKILSKQKQGELLPLCGKWFKKKTKNSTEKVSQTTSNTT